MPLEKVDVNMPRSCSDLGIGILTAKHIAVVVGLHSSTGSARFFLAAKKKLYN